MKVAFISLGCAKNQVNTEQMMALTAQAGYELIGTAVGADVAVVNTCGFIDSAKSEAIDQILALAELKAQGRLGKILVAGCLAQRYQTEILDELPEVDGLMGTGSYTDIVEALKSLEKGDTPTYFGDIHHTVEDSPRLVAQPSYTAYLKIAEGCDNHCAYCVIPSLRGKYRSREMNSLLAEAKALAQDGTQELIVIAQDITRYSKDWDGKSHLPQLLRELCKLPFRWIRLHYLYPDEFTDELIDVIAQEDKIVKYLDIPMQHASDKILKAMNRRGTQGELRALLTKLREKLPNVVIRTSIMVGFPGETGEDFETLCDFLKWAHMERAGVFVFSPQEGTVAYGLPDPVDENLANHRAQLLADLQLDIMCRWAQRHVGEVMEVLVEGFDGERNCYLGRTYADSPDIDCHVYFASPRELAPGDLVPVFLDSSDPDGDLYGQLKEE